MRGITFPIRPFISLLLVFGTLVLISCGEFENGKLTAEEKEDRHYRNQVAKLRSEYTAHEGTYAGVIKSPNRDIPAVIRIAMIEAENGLSSFGKTRSIPKLRATLILQDSVEKEIDFSVHQIQPGEFSFVSVESAKPEERQPGWSMIVKFVEDRIKGEVRYDNAVLGSFDFKLSTLKIVAPTEKEKQDHSRSLLQEIEGLYSGEVPFGDKPSEKAGIEISVSITKIGPPKVVVVCSLITKHGRFGSETMTGEYRPYPRPGTLIASSTGVPLKVCPFLSFAGQLTGPNLNTLTIDASLLTGGRFEADLAKSAK